MSVIVQYALPLQVAPHLVILVTSKQQLLVVFFTYKVCALINNENAEQINSKIIFFMIFDFLVKQIY